MHSNKKVTISILAASLWLVSALALLLIFTTVPGHSGAHAEASSGGVQPGQAAQTITPTPAASLYMPLMRVYKTPEVVLLKAWTSETLDGKLQAFLQSMPMLYQTSGLNNLGSPAKIGLNWQQSGMCSSGQIYNDTQIFSDTVTIQPGEWSHFIDDIHSPSCTGIFTATASMAYTNTNTSLALRFVVNEPGTVRVNLQQGFDKCYHPDIEDMQVWWEKSPYVVFNLYIGGVSYACKNQPLDAVYVRQLAEQGWLFIPTWVGPQAPCSKYTHKMSSDRDTAYQQGRDEADEAFKTAESLGLFGEKVIYYDLESYTGDDKCRNTVKAFMHGWTEQLQELGSKAGAYGASCRSYISDWATNNPPPDDIWIAHWYLDRYDPDATVWDAVCLDPDDKPPTYWLNTQRIRQYAGGHSETWGGVSLTIDSNALGGEVTFLPAAESKSAKALNGVQVEIVGSVLRDLELVDDNRGWLLADDQRLLWTEDGGENWMDIAPAQFSAASAGGRILDASFTDGETGLVIGLAGGEPAVLASRTTDGGRSWTTDRLPLDPQDALEIEAAYLEVMEDMQVFVALKLQSGSSFSRGRLFFTWDGGTNWEERALPVGEPVVFLDSQHGWTAGGPAGDLLYRTEDGGYTWQTQELNLPEGVQVEVGAPRFSRDAEGWLPVLLHEDGNSRMEIYATLDRGDTWITQDASHSHIVHPDLLLNQLMMGVPERALTALDFLPHNTLVADYYGEGLAWAIIQSGSCTEGTPGDLSGQTRCVQEWQFVRSVDGGRTWLGIPLPLDPGS
jgi:photosystem II stability/assembly factor-like uncharacterized protein